jgi:hypothetical protein
VRRARTRTHFGLPAHVPGQLLEPRRAHTDTSRISVAARTFPRGAGSRLFRRMRRSRRASRSPRICCRPRHPVSGRARGAVLLHGTVRALAALLLAGKSNENLLAACCSKIRAPLLPRHNACRMQQQQRKPTGQLHAFDALCIHVRRSCNAYSCNANSSRCRCAQNHPSWCVVRP